MNNKVELRQNEDGNWQGTFDATKFYELINLIDLKKESIDECLANTIASCNWSATNYRSEDSNIASVFDNLGGTISNVKEAMDINLDKVENAIRKYIDDTVANETRAATVFNEENEALEMIKNALNNINH